MQNVIANFLHFVPLSCLPQNVFKGKKEQNMHIQKKALLGHILEYKHSLKNKGNLEASLHVYPKIRQQCSSWSASVFLPPTTFKWQPWLIQLAIVFPLLVTNPLEVVKTRMQLDNELGIKHNSKNIFHDRYYRGFAKGFIRIFNEEGVRGLYRG